MHKMQCHSWGSNGKFASFCEFIDELIRDEIKHTSDEDFHYTFTITTSVTQTAKECIVKAEPFTIIPGEMDIIEMDVDISELNLSEQLCEPDMSNKKFPYGEKKSSTNIRSPKTVIHKTETSSSSEVRNSHRALCPLCGKEKSYANMRRHLKMVHKTEMDPQLNFTIKATLTGSSSHIRNRHKSDEENGSTKIRRHKTEANRTERGNSSQVPNPLKTLCPVCGMKKSSVNMRRHMKNVHKTEIDPQLDARIKATLRANHHNYNPMKMLCPVCGMEKSAANMRRHMRRVHKTKVNNEIATQIKAILRQRSSRDSNEMDHNIERVTSDDDPLKSVSSEISHEENSANVGSASMDVKCFVSHENTTNASQAQQPKAIKASDKVLFQQPTHKRCPLCERIITSANLKRHLSFAHSLSKSQIAEINLNVLYRCECKKFFRSSCKRHFKVAHNICNETELDRLHVVTGMSESAVQNEDRESDHLSPERNQSSETTESLLRFYSQCTLCSKTILRINLKRHYQSKHNIDESQTMQNLLITHAPLITEHNKDISKFYDEDHQSNHINQPIKGRFYCDICQKDFNEKRQIVSHMISHYSEKP